MTLDRGTGDIFFALRTIARNPGFGRRMANRQQDLHDARPMSPLRAASLMEGERAVSLAMDVQKLESPSRMLSSSIAGALIPCQAPRDIAPPIGPLEGAEALD